MTTAVDYAAVWDYEAQPKDGDHICNLCGTPNTVSHGVRDRYGYWPVQYQQCACGLNWLNPRMTAEAYRRFYETGAYRRLVSAYHGREINAETIQPEQREYGRRLADLLEPWVSPEATDVLDVGGSTGVVALCLSERFELTVTVLDPATDEVERARQPGVRVIPWAVEEWIPAPGDRFEVVTLCQTVDHLLDPMLALRKIRALLVPGGAFWVDALDYDRTRTIKIDHPFNFTEKTLRAMVEKAGFKIVQTSRNGDHVGFVCKGAE